VRALQTVAVRRLGWLGLLLTLSLVAVACAPLAPTPNSSELPDPVFDEWKAKASTPTFGDLFRNNERFVGQLVYYHVQLVQVVDTGTERYQIRAAVTDYPFHVDRKELVPEVFLRYEGSRLLEGDLIELVGTVVGLTTYTAELGSRITIPEINVVSVKLVSSMGVQK
jgi:hypothetical protein